MSLRRLAPLLAALAAALPAAAQAPRADRPADASTAAAAGGRSSARQTYVQPLVRQQQRPGFEAVGDFDGDRDAGAIFCTGPTNVSLVKATHWFSP